MERQFPYFRCARMNMNIRSAEDLKKLLGYIEATLVVHNMFITTTRSEDLFIQVRIQLYLSHHIVTCPFTLLKDPTCTTQRYTHSIQMHATLILYVLRLCNRNILHILFCITSSGIVQLVCACNTKSTSYCIVITCNVICQFILYCAIYSHKRQCK